MNFRAYKKSEKRMLRTFSLKQIMFNTPVTDEEWNDLVIMRGSGEFDENGVELFEGDTCKTQLGEYGMIIYSDGAFWLAFFYEPAKQHLSDFKYHKKPNTSLLITGLRAFV